MGYTASSWVNFALAVAGSAGALIGPLFVAVSIRSSAISASRGLSARAAETLVLFTTSLVVSLALVAPGFYDANDANLERIQPSGVRPRRAHSPAFPETPEEPECVVYGSLA